MARTPFIKAIIVSIVLAIPTVSTTWPSWWSDTTRYNGARTLENHSYVNLEIHGAATLNDITVSNNLLVTGSTEINRTHVQGTVTIRGALEVKADSTDEKDQSSFKTLDIAGSLIADNLSVSGALTVGRSIDATGCTFAKITTKRRNNQNETYSLTDSKFDSMYITGLGTKVVTLNNTSGNEIRFEHESGTVILQGSATVAHVINGTVKKK